MSKKFPKIFTIIFLSLVILQTGAFVFSALFYTPAKAAAKWTNPVDKIEIPGLKFSTPTKCLDDPTKTCVPWIGEYIAGIYNYAIGIVGILAAVVLMFGGVIWLTAGGSPEKVNEAKAWIGAALSGLVLALSSYMILYQVNPDLIKLNPLKVSVVTEKKAIKGCCEYKNIPGKDTYEPEDINVAAMMMESECTAKKGTWNKYKTLKDGKCLDKVLVDKCCQAKQKMPVTDSIHCADIKEDKECVKEVFSVTNQDNLYEITDFGLDYKCNLEQGKCAKKPYSAIDQISEVKPSTTALNEEIGIKEGVITDGLQYEIVSVINQLAIRVGPENIVITSGREGEHSTNSEYNHANGYKVDLRLDNVLSDYIENNYTFKGTRSDGARMWEAPNGCYALENDHWDVSGRYCPKGS